MVIQGPWQSRPGFEPGQLITVVTSEYGRSYHWLRINESGARSLAGTTQAICGTRPTGYVGNWQEIDPEVENAERRLQYLPPLEACPRCVEKRDA